MQEKLKIALAFCIKETETQIIAYMLGCAETVKDMADELERLYKLLLIEKQIQEKKL